MEQKNRRNAKEPSEDDRVNARRKRNLESQRRTRKRKQQEEERMVNSFEENEVRIAELEKIVGELTTELNHSSAVSSSKDSKTRSSTQWSASGRNGKNRKRFDSTLHRWHHNQVEQNTTIEPTGNYMKKENRCVRSWE